MFGLAVDSQKNVFDACFFGNFCCRRNMGRKCANLLKRGGRVLSLANLVSYQIFFGCGENISKNSDEKTSGKPLV